MDKGKTGVNLRQIRQARKMSMEKLARKINSSNNTVCIHEREGIKQVEYLLRYAEALGCEPSDLLADTVDIERFSLEEDITSFYPWNLAYAVMVGSIPTKGSVENASNEVYRVYVPALKEAVAQLTDREQKVIEMRFVHDMTYEQCGYRFNVTKERIRQVEQKAIHKLRNPRFRKHYLLDTLDKAFEIDAKRARLERENIELRIKLEKYENVPKPKIEPRKIDIANMELSVRSYNCLKRAGFNFVDDLDGMTYERLSHVRNLGRKSIMEVIAKASEFGIIIPTEDTEYNQILDYIKTHGSITYLEAFREIGCTRLAEIIHDLRRRGYKITSGMKTVPTTDGTAREVVYRLRE